MKLESRHFSDAEVQELKIMINYIFYLPKAIKCLKGLKMIAPIKKNKALINRHYSINEHIFKYGLEINKIYNEDCLIGMEKIKDKSIDMILCDLPYGTTQNKWDSIIPLNDYIEIEIKNKIVSMNENEYKLYCFENNLPIEIFNTTWKKQSKKGLWTHYKRIIKDNGAIVLTASQPFTTKLIHSNYRMFKYTWTWDKKQITGFLNSKRQPLRKTEDILVFYKQQCIYNPQMTKGEAYTINRQHATDNYGKQKANSTINRGERYPTNILSIPQIRVKGGHPTQKPVELGRFLIKTYTKEGDIVLDNASGSGSFLLSAKKENRKYLGFEIEKEYFHMSKERLK